MKNDASSHLMENFNIAPLRSGVLDGLSFIVKDAFDIAHKSTGFGSPLWLETHPTAAENAICVDQLLAQGARCIGKGITGELGCGSSGVNNYYGMPINPKAPERVPGGSSSGAASAVASNLVDFSLATDSGGSVRVPASFCGILGLRSSQGIISMAGVTPLVPSLDTVGILANSIDVIHKATTSLMGVGENYSEVKDIFVLEDCLALATPTVRDSVEYLLTLIQKKFAIKPIKIKLSDIDKNAGDLDGGIADTFLNIFCGEMWTSISAWAESVNLEYGKNTYVDFSHMKNLDRIKIAEAMLRREFYFERLNKFLPGNSLICIPTTADIAPMRPAVGGKVNSFDYDKLRPLISIASIGRLPQINIPILLKDKPPVGVSLIARHRNDHALINIAKQLIEAIKS